VSRPVRRRPALGCWGLWLALGAAVAAPPRGFCQELEFHSPASPADANVSTAMRDLAERLLPVYEESDPDRYLANLSALQMAAGDYGPADLSRESLRDRRRRIDSGRPVGRGAIFDIYAHAKALEARERIPFSEAYTKAHQEVVGHLSDHDAYAVARWLEVPAQESRDNFQKLLDEQRPKDIIDQAEAVQLLWAYLGYEAYRAFASLVDPLDAEDDARRYRVEDNILIAVPNRPSISATIIRPKNASGVLAALLELGIDASRDYAKESAAHGYAGIAAHLVLGAHESPFVPFQHDGEEARAVIAWITKQPWSDGRVGMFGEGYSGFVPWAAASRPPAALRAIAAFGPIAPGIDMPMAGNIFQNSAYRWSLQATNIKPQLDSRFEDDAIWRALNEKWYRSGRRYRDLGQLYGEPDAIFIRWLNHPSYDRFWQSMIPYGAQFAHLDIPVLTMTGYFAESEPGALYYFTEHVRANPHANHTLLIGPFDDSAMQRGASPELRGYEVDSAAHIDLRELRYRWFDHVMKSAAAPPQLSGRVNYEVMGANEWQHAPSLEAMAGASIKFYLDAAASGEHHRLVRRKNPKLSAVPQTVSFTDRADAGWMPPTDLISKSLVTHNAVIFVSDPLAKPLQIGGLMSGRLDFYLNKMDVDLDLMMYELLSNGDYVRLFNPTSELRLSYAQDRAHRHLLKAGERQQTVFRSERMTGRQIQAGSRLIVALRIGKRPDREINYGTGNDVSEESIADGKTPLKIRWYNDSYIEIPVRAK
jgi:uncharacterized protein